MKMIDRMAQAMCEAQTWIGAWEKAPKAERNAWLWLALAALKAMREPSEKLGERGFQVFDQSDRDNAVEWMREAFTAMIDSAIKEAEAE